MIVFVLFAAVAGVLCGPTEGRVAAAADCVVSDILVNSCRPWLGGAAGHYSNAPVNTRKGQLEYHEQRIGRPLDIVHEYYGVGSRALTSDDLALARREGTFLFANWKPAATWAAAGGGNDAANASIDAMAASVKSLGDKKIFMTVWHEPENDTTSDPACPGTTFKGSAGTPDQYRAMWANVRARFRTAGVTNVVWVVDYMNYSPWDCLVYDLYPGDDLVDWIMWNGYQTSETDVSWEDKVGRTYDRFTADSGPGHDFLSKPWGIVEWNSYHTSQPKVLDYYQQVQAAIDAGRFPKLKALMVYDDGYPDGSGRVGYDKDGKLAPDEQAAYTRLAQDPLLAGGWRYGTADTTDPTASLGAPVDGATASGDVQVRATVADDTGVATANLAVDGVDKLPLTVSGGTATGTWDSTTVPDGAHTLKVTVTDAAGNTGTSAPVTVTVSNPDTTAPAPPTNLLATSVDPHSIRLTWTAGTDDHGITGYRVFRNGQPLAARVSGDATTYLDEGLDPLTRYTYEVAAVDGKGNESVRSASSSAATGSEADTTAPTAPGQFHATAVSPGQVHLSWNASSDDRGVVAYTLYRDGAELGRVTDGSTTYDDTTVTGGTTYRYTIVASDAAGNPSDDGADTVTTPAPADTTPPSAPVNLTGTATSSTAVALSWGASTDDRGVTGYHVYRDGTQVALLGATTTSYTDAPVSAGTRFSYTVKAEDAAGNLGPAGPAAVVTTPPPPDRTPPSVPTGLKAVPAGSTVKLTWNASTDNVKVTAYKVFRDGVQIGTASAPSTAYQDATARQGTSHTYTVAATDAAGNTGTRSAGVTVKVPDTTPPGAPGSFTATPGTRTVTLAWTKATDNVAVTGYSLFRNGTRIASPAATATGYQDKNLKAGTKYTYQLKATDAAGNVGPPATVTATPR